MVIGETLNGQIVWYVSYILIKETFLCKNGNIRESKDSISFCSSFVNLSNSHILVDPQSHCLVDFFRAFPVLKSMILMLGNDLITAVNK